MARIRVGWSEVRNLVWLTAMVCIASAISTLPLSAQNAAPGSVDLSFAAPPVRDVQFVLAQPNGHLFVAGRFSIPGVGTHLVRLTADGTYDPTFAPTSSIPAVTALALQPDGKLLTGFQWWGVRRLLPDGSRDPSFNFVPPDVHPRIIDFYFWTTALAVQPDGRILICGYRIYDSLAEDERYFWTMSTVYRLLSDGTLDSTFKPFTAIARGLAVLPDDRILVVGADLTLLHPDGTKDTNFVAGPFAPRIDRGAVREDQTFATTLDSFAIQPDGRILVGGSFTNVQGHARWHLARVLPDGRLDLSFNPPIFIGNDLLEPKVKALAVQADGRILVGGALPAAQSSDAWTVVRLNPDGSLDATFSPLIERYDDDEEELGIVSSIVIQDQKRAVIGGSDLDVADLFRIHLGELQPPVCDGFCITSIDVQTDLVTITWRAQPGETYYVEFKAALTDPNWTPASGGIIAQGTQASWTGLRAPGAASAFYRVAKVEE